MDCGTTERLFRSIARNAAQGVSLGKRKSKPTFVDGEIRVPPPTFRTPFGPARPPKAVLKKIRWNRKRISLRRARVAHFVRPFLRPPRSGAFLTQQDTPARSNKVVILPWCLVKRLFNSFKAQLRCHGNCRHWNFTTRRELGSLRWLLGPRQHWRIISGQLRSYEATSVSIRYSLTSQRLFAVYKGILTTGASAASHTIVVQGGEVVVATDPALMSRSILDMNEAELDELFKEADEDI